MRFPKGSPTRRFARISAARARLAAMCRASRSFDRGLRVEAANVVGQPLRTEEKARRGEDAHHAKRARLSIAQKWFFLACAELIEAEVMYHEAEAVKRAREVVARG